MYLQSMFEQKQEKYQTFSSENFQNLQLKKFLYIAWACFHNDKFVNDLPMVHVVECVVCTSYGEKKLGINCCHSNRESERIHFSTHRSTRHISLY